jgi:AcrR family transcriptional regulator
MFSKGGIQSIMNQKDKGLRQRIIDSAKAILSDGTDVDKITVRQIAERAGVGIGLINYHFTSKDNLLAIARGDETEIVIARYANEDNEQGLEPSQKLRMLLKDLCASAGNDAKLVRFMLLKEITEGCMQAPLHLIPMLREIIGEQVDEMQLRIIALQILQPLQLAGLNPEPFHMFSGIDISDPEQLSRFIDALIDNLIDTKRRR